VSDRIKSFKKINGGQNSSVGRFFLLKAVPNRLGQAKNLIDCGPTSSKAGLVIEIRFLDSR